VQVLATDFSQSIQRSQDHDNVDGLELTAAFVAMLHPICLGLANGIAAISGVAMVATIICIVNRVTHDAREVEGLENVRQVRAVSIQGQGGL
jgi:hypothetical protein